MRSPTDSNSPLSVLIPVKNEAENIRDCLRSVAFANEVVVVDSHSSDATVEIASSLDAKVVQFDWDGRFPRKKNWALENFSWRNEWILIIDADERVTPELRSQVENAIQRNDVDGYYLNRRFWFLDGWINHCGYFPSWNLRLFRHRSGRYEKFEAGGNSGDNEVHEHVLIDGEVAYLSAPMEHYAFPNLESFIEKHNRYSSWEASAREQFLARGEGEVLDAKLLGTSIERKRWLKRISLHLPFRPTLRFLYHYLLRQGFRDGRRGWILCRLLGWYEFVSLIKARECDLLATARKTDASGRLRAVSTDKSS